MKLHATRNDREKRIIRNEFKCLAKIVVMNMYNHQSYK